MTRRSQTDGNVFGKCSLMKECSITKFISYNAQITMCHTEAKRCGYGLERWKCSPNMYVTSHGSYNGRGSAAMNVQEKGSKAYRHFES